MNTVKVVTSGDSETKGLPGIIILFHLICILVYLATSWTNVIT